MWLARPWHWQQTCCDDIWFLYFGCSFDREIMIAALWGIPAARQKTKEVISEAGFIRARKRVLPKFYGCYEMEREKISAVLISHMAWYKENASFITRCSTMDWEGVNVWFALCLKTWSLFSSVRLGYLLDRKKKDPFDSKELNRSYEQHSL